MIWFGCKPGFNRSSRSMVEIKFSIDIPIGSFCPRINSCPVTGERRKHCVFTSFSNVLEFNEYAWTLRWKQAKSRTDKLKTMLIGEAIVFDDGVDDEWCKPTRVWTTIGLIVVLYVGRCNLTTITTKLSNWFRRWCLWSRTGDPPVKPIFACSILIVFFS